jgi:hypothetical protein
MMINYRIPGKLKLLFFTGIIITLYILFRNSSPPALSVYEKINGTNLVGTPNEIHIDQIKEISKNHIDWISLIPFAFSIKGQPNIYYNTERQWHGETRLGLYETACLARQEQLRIMVKPHVWVRGDGWPGEFDLDNENNWLEWENNYRKYILEFADLADSVNAEIFCIGTEFRIASIERPAFWKKLIKDIRKIYKGKITYAANWDNYQNIKFWEDLDYIGIDAYFPLSDEKTPSVDILKKKWKPIKHDLESFAYRYNKPVLFTEYGYQSMDYNTSGHWKNEKRSASVNLDAQKNAYCAFFETFWMENWVAGGFFWKWYPDYVNAGGSSHKDFTPQNKDAMQLVHIWYSKKNIR